MKLQAAIGIAVICVGVALTALTTSPANGQQQHTVSKHESVSAWVYQDGVQDANGQYYYTGAKIYVSSSSPGAPVFPQCGASGSKGLTEIGVATAQLLNLGFHLEKVSDNGLYFLFIK